MESPAQKQSLGLNVAGTSEDNKFCSAVSQHFIRMLSSSWNEHTYRNSTETELRQARELVQLMETTSL
jgi:hypothetical protein